MLESCSLRSYGLRNLAYLLILVIISKDLRCDGRQIPFESADGNNDWDLTSV